MSSGKGETKTNAYEDDALEEDFDVSELFPHNNVSWDSILYKNNWVPKKNGDMEVSPLVNISMNPRKLETFISLEIEKNDCVFPHNDVVLNQIKAFWKLTPQNTKMTYAMVMLNKNILFGFCSKNYSGGYVGHAETDLMSALVKAVRTNTLNVANLDSIDVYSTLQPCAMCSTVIHRAVNWLIKQKKSPILCNVYFTQKDEAMGCPSHAKEGEITLLSTAEQVTLLTNNGSWGKKERDIGTPVYCKYHYILPPNSRVQKGNKKRSRFEDCKDFQEWENKSLSDQITEPIYASIDMKLDDVCEEAIWALYGNKNWHWHDTVQQFMRPNVNLGQVKEKPIKKENEKTTNASNVPKALRSWSHPVAEFDPQQAQYYARGKVSRRFPVHHWRSGLRSKSTDDPIGRGRLVSPLAPLPLRSESIQIEWVSQKFEDSDYITKFYFVPPQHDNDEFGWPPTTLIQPNIFTMWSKVVNQNLGIESKST